MTTTPDTLAKLAADNVPERIYLVLGEDIAPDDDPRADFNELGEVTWCADKQFNHDIEYVRADVAALAAQAPTMPSDFAPRLMAVVKIYQEQAALGIAVDAELFRAVSRLVAAQALPAAEPFGYFKAEPFGWTDCEPTAEGAIALYEHPQQAAQATAGWQPIETAPKDGRAILVSDGRFVFCVEWNEEFDWWGVDDNKLGPFRLRGAAPTHWQPLPAPPAALPQPQSAQSKGDA